MPLLHRFIKSCSALLAFGLLATAAIAADPTGTWSWTSPGRNGQNRASTMKLVLKDGALSGSVTGMRGNDNPIAAASFKDPDIAFSVTVHFGDNDFTIKYAGKLAGDTITGTVEFPGRDGGEPVKRPWKAKRTSPAVAMHVS